MANISKILNISGHQNRSGKLTIPLLISLAVCVIGQAANADTSIYVFDPNQSTIFRSGGIAGIQKTFSIDGQFRLTIDSGANTASFEIVDANMTDEIGAIYGQNLDEIFNMTGLSGTVIDDTTIEFEGKTADGTESNVSLSLKLSIKDDSAHLTGQTTPPPNSADMFFYDVNAVAIKKYAGGTGEPNDPYLIYTAEQLNAIGAEPNDWDKNFKLMADIDLSGFSGEENKPEFNIIAKDSDTNTEDDQLQEKHFTGVFDGNGHRILNFAYHSDSMDKVGLFGYLGHGSLIRDLGLENVNVTGFYEVGSLAGANHGSVVNCYSTGFVGGGSDVGGLIGFLTGLVFNCYSTCIVSGDSEIGGLVGDSCSGRLINCYSTGDVNGVSEVGGLMGFNEGEIINCYSNCITNGKTQVGGLVGSNGYGAGQVTNSYSSGLVNGESDVGGLIGLNVSGFVTNSFWDIETSGQINSDGGIGLTTMEMQDPNTYLNAGWDFVDETSNGTHDYWQISPGSYPRLRYHIGDRPMMPEGLGTIQEPYLIRDARDLGTMWSKPMAYYRLEESIDLSGITWTVAVVPWFGGTFDGNGHLISNLHIQGSEYLGLFGQLESRAVISSLGLEAVDVNGTDYYAGGLAGFNDGTITTSNSSGAISGISRIGGLVGFNNGNIISSYSTVKISGISNVGGLVGDNHVGNINMSYSTGTVTGSKWSIGGLVGWNWGSIDKSYSTSTITGNEDVGGLVGRNEGSIATSYSTGTVSFSGEWSGSGGGLVGCNYGSIATCYSKGTVSGDRDVGGLVGDNSGSIVTSYSMGLVTGNEAVGGLVGFNWEGTVNECFWDIQTSGQTMSAGGTGKATDEMQTADTYLEAGWDFVDESANGTEDIWSICEGTNYPRLVWQIPAGDFVCPDGITIDDFMFFMEHWLDENCDSSNGYCEGTDLDHSGTVDVNDLEIFFENWSAEK